MHCRYSPSFFLAEGDHCFVSCLAVNLYMGARAILVARLCATGRGCNRNWFSFRTLHILRWRTICAVVTHPQPTQHSVCKPVLLRTRTRSPKPGQAIKHESCIHSSAVGLYLPPQTLRPWMNPCLVAGSAHAQDGTKRARVSQEVFRSQGPPFFLSDPI